MSIAVECKVGFYCSVIEGLQMIGGHWDEMESDFAAAPAERKAK